jgi:hypothetical protein
MDLVRALTVLLVITPEAVERAEMAETVVQGSQGGMQALSTAWLGTATLMHTTLSLMVG